MVDAGPLSSAEGLFWLVFITSLVFWFIPLMRWVNLNKANVTWRRVATFPVIAYVIYHYSYRHTAAAEETSVLYGYLGALALTVPFLVATLFLRLSGTVASMVWVFVTNGIYFGSTGVAALYVLFRNQVETTGSQVAILVAPFVLYAILLPAAFRHNARRFSDLQGAEKFWRKLAFGLLWATESILLTFFATLGMYELVYNKTEEPSDLADYTQSVAAVITVSGLATIRWLLCFHRVEEEHISRSRYSVLDSVIAEMSEDITSSS